MIPDDLRYTDAHEWVRDRPTAWCASASPTTRSSSSATSCSSTCPPSATRSRPARRAARSSRPSPSRRSTRRVAGEVAAVNDALEDDPELVNSAPYGDGWMLDIRPADAAQLEGLLDAAAYARLTDATDRHADDLRRPSAADRSVRRIECRRYVDTETARNAAVAAHRRRRPRGDHERRAGRAARARPGDHVGLPGRLPRRRRAARPGSSRSPASTRCRPARRCWWSSAARTRVRVSCSTARPRAPAGTRTATSSSTTSPSPAGTRSSAATPGSSWWSTSAA